MHHQRKNFLRALSLLNSLLVPFFFLFLIDRLNFSYLLKFSYIFVLLIIGCLKIYGMSALSGCLLEILSNEEPVLCMRRVHPNAKNLWPGFLIAFATIQLIDFILFALFPALRIWRSLYLPPLATVAAYVLARWTINKKYLEPFRIPRRKFKFNLSFLGIIISACILELILAKFSYLIHIEGLQWQNISIFIINYIHVFEFIFCALYIIDGYPEVPQEFSRQKEIFLINPMGGGVTRSLAYWFVRIYPAVFVVLKALTPKTYKFCEFSHVLWHERYYKNNVLVCITCLTSNCYEAYKIAKEFKKRGSTVILGGPHVTCLPNEALAFCDSVIVGQAEGVWKNVIRDYENGHLQLQYSGPASEVDYAQVHQELLNSPPSIIKDFLETTRGCKFKCHFCTISALSGGQTHSQPVSAIVELIKKIRPHYSAVAFLDDNIYANPDYAKELFLALKPLKIKWHGQCSIDIAQNRETLKLARESGCTGLLLGYEISGKSLEKKQGGKFAMAQKYFEYTKIIKKAGIKIKGHFIFGFDSDNLKTLWELWKFCFALMPQFTAVTLLTPLPSSGVYRDMLTQNRIISLNWRSYTLHRLVIRHAHINPTGASFFFPLLQTFFLITTSWGGFIIFVFISSVSLWIASLCF